MPLDLEPSKIKIRAARNHVARLNQRCSPLDPELFTVDLQETFEGPAILAVPKKVYRLVYKPKGPIPETLADIVGDALGSLRSALDYAAVRIVPGNGKIYFPVAPRQDLTNHPSLAPCEAALPGFRDLLLQVVRPVGGPDEPLWDLVGKANNEHKHVDFIPTVTGVEIQNINATLPGNNVLKDCSFGGDAAREMILVQARGPISFTQDHKTIVEVKFGPNTSVPNQLVVPILEKTTNIIERTLNELDKLANP